MAAVARKQSTHPYRMKDLCELTGLTRQAIHFYIQQGLLAPGVKTGRNMAYYSQEHVDRLELIRKLQHERFLPLKAIKAVLDDETGGFAPDQRQLLREVKSHMDASLGPRSPERTVDALDAARDAGLDRRELRKLGDLGLISLVEDDRGLRVLEDDAWVLEHWQQIRDAGFSADLGFSVDDLALYEETVTSLFDRERQLVLERLAGQPPEQVAAMLERVLPLINSFFARYHTALVRNFFAAME